MEQREIDKLGIDDERIVELFVNLGMPKTLAKTLVYISESIECLSVEIERGADLRQPEVSIAVQELNKRGWINKRDVKKEGKGRPTHIYKPTTSLLDVLNALKIEKMKEFEDVNSDLEELEKILKSK